MKRPSLKYFIASFISLLVIICINILVDYVGNEGFNPSDEGVIIAQSYRIVNGEVPHKDFVSIRPAGSGILHTIHFLSPFSLIQSMRWLVIIQFFSIALIMAVVLKILLEEDLGLKMSLIQFIIVLILAYTLNVLDYNLFLWTTIDALMLSVVAFIFLIALPNQTYIFQVIALFLISWAVLCRQTFILPAMALFLSVFINNIKQHRFFRGVSLMMIGLSPIIAYVFWLFIKGGFGDFISQMTGRTELFETGVIQYLKYFLKSYSLPLHLLVFGLFIANTLERKSNTRLKILLSSKSYYLSILIMLYMFVIIFYHFLDGNQNIYFLPFELFWLCLDMFLLSWISVKISQKTFHTVLFVLFISWTSSISLGDNSPVFASGLLSVMILYLSMLINRVQVLKDRDESVRLLAFGFVLVLGVFISSFVGQRMWNYRDLPSKELTFNLSEVHPNFYKIKTNEITGKYYLELKQIFESLPDAKNKTIVLPNNAIFYPIFDSKNPLPLDWMQPAEYIGQEARIFNAVLTLCKTPGYYFIVDKIESKNMAFEIEPLHYGSYDYFSIIFDKCEEINIDSDFFVVYKSK
jgi:hypothetical protein